MKGIGIGRGTVTGPVARMGDPLPEPSAQPSTDTPQSEQARATAALAEVAAYLNGSGHEVLEAQALMAEDPVLKGQIDALIAEGKTAARAVFEAFEGYAQQLAAAGGYLAERVADLNDVRQRVVAACLGVAAPGLPRPGHPHILVALDLAPADTINLDEHVLAFVTVEGGPTSHTAILARSKGIPAVVGCADAQSLGDGDVILVDAELGEVIVNPSPEQAQARQRTRRADLGQGHHVPLLANIGSPDEVEAAIAAGAEGVGLLRTEFLFPDSVAPPSVETQLVAYQKVFAGFAGKPVVVRVLDAGADKPLRYLTRADEPNPALGMRGIRALRRTPFVLETQLAAIAQAAAITDAKVQIMAPMVSTVDEARWFATQAPAPGVMIEVPSAALLAEEILAEVDFVSIGTNDLTQYVLAADRQLGALASYQDPWHPAVLRLIKMICDAGQRTGKGVGVCGEAAADPKLACVLVGMGVTSLSMAPAALADVREELASHTFEQCVALAVQAL